MRPEVGHRKGGSPERNRKVHYGFSLRKKRKGEWRKIKRGKNRRKESRGQE